MFSFTAYGHYTFPEYCTGKFIKTASHSGHPYSDQEISDISSTIKTMMSYYEDASGKKIRVGFKKIVKRNEDVWLAYGPTEVEFYKSKTVCNAANEWFKNSGWTKNEDANNSDPELLAIPSMRDEHDSQVYEIHNVEPLLTFSNIKKLALPEHSIRNVSKLAKLGLKALDLSRFNIEPDGIGSLTTLEYLDLSSDSAKKFKTIPDLGNLRKLKVLKLDGNRIDNTTLNEIALKTPKLEQLSLKDNKLEQLDSGIVSKPNLRMLDVSSNSKLKFSGLHIKSHRADGQRLTIMIDDTRVEPEWHFFNHEYVGADRPNEFSYKQLDDLLRKGSINHTHFKSNQEAFHILRRSMTLLLDRQFEDLLDGFDAEFGRNATRELLNFQGKIQSVTERHYKSTLLIEAVKLSPQSYGFIQKILDLGADSALEDSLGFSAVSYAKGFDDHIALKYIAKAWEDGRLHGRQFTNPFSVGNSWRDPRNQTIQEFCKHISLGLRRDTFNKCFTKEEEFPLEIAADLEQRLTAMGVAEPQKSELIQVCRESFEKVIQSVSHNRTSITVSNYAMADRLQHVEHDVVALYQSLDVSNILAPDELELVMESDETYIFYTRLAGLIERTMMEIGFQLSGAMSFDTSSDGGMKVIKVASDIASTTTDFIPFPGVGNAIDIVLKIAEKSREHVVLKRLKKQAERKEVNGRCFNQIGELAKKVAVNLLRKYNAGMASATPGLLQLDSEETALVQAAKMHTFFVSSLDNHSMRAEISNVITHNKAEIIADNIFPMWSEQIRENKKLFKTILAFCPEVTEYIGDVVGFVTEF